MSTPSRHVSLNIVGSAVVLACALSAPSVWATTACPGVFSGASPNGGGGGGGAAICAVDGSGNVTCDLDRNGSSGAVANTLAYFVLTSTGGTEFLAYGFDGLGAKFCSNSLTMAAADANCARELTVYGSVRPNELKLQDPVQGWHMNCNINTVFGEDNEDDVITTSATDTNNYVYTYSGVDVVHGYAGFDWVEGGGSGDYIWTGGGNDWVYGEEGNDKIKTEDGADYAYGGDGDDLICGGDGVDNLYGEGGDDLLFGGTSVDMHDGGTGFNYCENDAGWVDCDVRTLTTCPW